MSASYIKGIKPEKRQACCNDIREIKRAEIDIPSRWTFICNLWVTERVTDKVTDKGDRKT